MADTKLKTARELLGITQSELDREAGLAKGTTFDLEAGRTENPGHATVVRIIRALKRRGLPGADAEKLFPVADDDQRRQVAS